MNQRNKSVAVLLGLALSALAMLLSPLPALAVRQAKPGASDLSESDMQAKRLLDRALELIASNEQDRGIKMLETILQQYPKSPVRYSAYLALGRHYLDNREQLKAVNYLRNLKQLEADAEGEPLVGEQRDLYLEAMYLSGVSYFQIRQYGSAFPILRTITNDYPNTVWANQSYYYIGMCHFAQTNWNAAIKALNLVGTFVDPDSPSIQYVEAGRRFYAKVSDDDLPVLHRLGKQVSVEVSTKTGDKEIVDCIPLPGSEDIFVGSIATSLGVAKPGDGELQVIGGDEISTRYIDSNTQEGAVNVGRVSIVKVVSTASVLFAQGDFETRAAAAYIGQPGFLVVQDADLDKTAQNDELEVHVLSRYRQQEDETQPTAAGPQKKGIGVNLEQLFAGDEVVYQVRDEMTVKLKELGQAQPVHTGRFGGTLQLEKYRDGQPFNKNDQVLTCAVDDEIVVSFVDELHIGGDSPRQASASVKVADEINALPRVMQPVVSDPVLASRKNLVEAEAYLELARITKSMGLLDRAKLKAREGLDRVDSIIRSRAPLPAEITERAFKLKWELFLSEDDFGSAIATCRLFNSLFPESPFVDQALMGIAQIKINDKDFQEAISVYQQVLGLPHSSAKAEAQFRIAEATEKSDTMVAKKGFSERAIAAYKQCAQKYPDSEYAGASLAKLVDYYIETKDYSQANDLLDQIFTDYPDAKFLDSMLLKAVMVSYRMNDFEKSYEKCSQLIFEYPDSVFADRAKSILPKIEQKTKKQGGGDEAAKEATE